jgi:iron(III) transport system substrate-binding protein
MSKTCILLIAYALAAALCGCGEDGPSVVLYVSADEHLAREVIERFEQDTGIEVLLVGDTEASKTTGLVERLRAERDAPQADVFWSSEIFMTLDLADEGVLAPHESTAVEDWPAAWRDPAGRWYGFAARARVIVYATNRVSAADVPDSWTDLDDAEWRGRVVMADPRFGTTGGHLGAMKAYWDRAYQPGIYGAWLIGLQENGVRLLPSGNAGVVRAVADGEADLGMTDTDDVWAAQALGLEVDLVYPRHGVDDIPGTGTLLIPNTVGRVAGGPNADAAGALIDFLLSETVVRMMAESSSRNIPLRPSLADVYPESAVPNTLEIDYRRAARSRTKAVEMAMERLGGAQ